MSGATPAATRKLGVFAAVLAVVLTVCGGWAWSQLSGAAALAPDASEAGDTEVSQCVPGMVEVLHDAGRWFHQRALIGDPEPGAALERELLMIRGRMWALTARLRKGSPPFSDALAQVEKAFHELATVGERARDWARQRQFDRARQVMRSEFDPRFEQLRTYFGALGSEVRKRQAAGPRARQAAALADARRTVVWGGVLFVATLGGGFFWLRRGLAEAGRTFRELETRLEEARRVRVELAAAREACREADDEVNRSRAERDRIQVEAGRVADEMKRELAKVREALRASDEAMLKLGDQHALASRQTGEELAGLRAALRACELELQQVRQSSESARESAGSPASGPAQVDAESAPVPAARTEAVRPAIPEILPLAWLPQATEGPTAAVVEPVRGPDAIADPSPRADLELAVAPPVEVASKSEAEPRTPEPAPEMAKPSASETEPSATSGDDELDLPWREGKSDFDTLPGDPATAAVRPPAEGASETSKPKVERPRRAPRETPQLNLLAAEPTSADEEMRRWVESGRLPGVDLDDARSRLGQSREEIERHLVEAVPGQLRALAELRRTIEEGDRDQARLLAQALAVEAGELSEYEFRRLAKTIELAIKFQHGDVGAMVVELEREAARVFAGLEWARQRRRDAGDANA